MRSRRDLDGSPLTQVVDKLGLKEVRGRLLLRLGVFDEARHVYAELLGRNPEQFTYHAGLQARYYESLHHNESATCTPSCWGVTRSSLLTTRGCRRDTINHYIIMRP